MFQEPNKCSMEIFTEVGLTLENPLNIGKMTIPQILNESEFLNDDLLRLSGQLTVDERLNINICKANCYKIDYGLQVYEELKWLLGSIMTEQYFY